MHCIASSDDPAMQRVMMRTDHAFLRSSRKFLVSGELVDAIVASPNGH
jgi:hypothetical protein